MQVFNYKLIYFESKNQKPISIELGWNCCVGINLEHLISRSSMGTFNLRITAWSFKHKIWARSVQPFWRLLDTNKQTNTQTPMLNFYIDFLDFQNFIIIKFCWRQTFEMLILHKPSLGPLSSTQNLGPIGLV